MQQIVSTAGKPADPSLLVNVPRLISAYYLERPDISELEQRVKFGTSGHRGSSFERSFNEQHILAISQAICDYRKEQAIDGPLFLGIDTHALSIPAMASALEVLSANGVQVMLAENDEYTPTPVISHAILSYNKGRKSHLADGIVITPSHNPPNEGGFKYNPSNGGPAEPIITNWIEGRANDYIRKGMLGVERLSFEKALRASTTSRYNYLDTYVKDLVNVLDMKIIRETQINIAVDPLGGAGVHYWKRIADYYGLNLTIISDIIDPTFSFMTVDWDGKIRMDPSSPYAMKRLIDLKDRFKIAFACDADHDRHGIVTRSAGLLPTNHFLSAAIFYLFQNRVQWKKGGAVGKTLVSSQMIDFISHKMGRKVYEVPVGFKWFVEGLFDGSLVIVGEESAGAAFARLDGSVWTTDKDGITASLLAAEITARTGKDPGEIYRELTKEFGVSYFNRVETPASKQERDIIKGIKPEQISLKTLAGEKITSIFSRAPGNNQPIGGIKIVAETGWMAIRPSGTEDIIRIYAESFQSQKHLNQITEQAQEIASTVLESVTNP